MNIKPKYKIYETKVVDIIRNCETLEQLETAKKYVTLVKAIGKKSLTDYENTCKLLDDLIQLKINTILLK